MGSPAGDGEPDPGEQFRSRVEEFLLGGPTHLTRGEVSERVGVSVDEAARLWRALGFPDVGDDQPAFADSDVEALRLAVDLKHRGVLDDASQAWIARTVGQGMSRLAEWQVSFVFALLTDRPEAVLGSERSLYGFVSEMIPILERIHTYAWRRHLDAFTSRALAADGRSGDAVIGFVDISGYTSLTRKTDADALAGLLERFESMAADLVSAAGGRVVKSLGDEILFTSNDPAPAVRLALEIVARCNADDDLPDVRAGLAYGPVVNRLGDVFGSTVNLASRLTSVARPNSVLTDRTLADLLRDDDEVNDLTLRPLSRVSVRGFAHLQPWLVRASRSA